MGNGFSRKKHPRGDEEGEVRDQEDEEQESSRKRKKVNDNTKVDDNTTSVTSSAKIKLTSAEEGGSVVKNKHAISIKRSGDKKILHLWIWIRESPKWWLLMILNGWASQLMRILMAAERYAEENDLQLVVHGVVYAEQISRREVIGSGAFAKLLHELLGFQFDVEEDLYTDFTSGDKLWVMCTEYLRFGEDPAEVDFVLKSIEDISVSGVNFRVVTLKEFDLDSESCMEALKELHDSLKAIAENASNKNTGKQVEIDPPKKKEREDVEREAKTIEDYFREHKCLPEPTQQNTNFYRPKTDDVEELTKTFIEAQERLGKSENLNREKVKDAVSFIDGAVCGNMQLMKSPKGGLDIAFYFRSSGGTSVDKVPIELEDGGGTFDVPLEQLAHNMAMLSQLQRQDDDIRITLFYDDQKSRDSRCNPEFALFLHGVLSRKFSSAVISQWNRISTHSEAFDILQELCSTRDVSLYFSKEIGQNPRDIAITENNRRDLQRECVERFNERMDEIRGGNGISSEYLTIGRKQFTKEEKTKFIDELRRYGLNDDFISELDETANRGSLDADLSE